MHVMKYVHRVYTVVPGYATTVAFDRDLCQLKSYAKRITTMKLTKTLKNPSAFARLF